MNPFFAALRFTKAGASMGQYGCWLLVAIASWLLAPAPALAHHPLDGALPSNGLEGLLSGLGHPVIGLDHLAFVVAAGLLAAAMGRGLGLPLVFVAAAVGGTGLHLMGFDLPALEFTLAASVLVFGGLLARSGQPSVVLVLVLMAIAGLFHGYAYGEAIIGAEPTPLGAYLLGFTTGQWAIAAIAHRLGKRWVSGHEAYSLPLRFAGFTLAGIGGALVSGVLLG